jgi:hypothetical protein
MKRIAFAALFSLLLVAGSPTLVATEQPHVDADVAWP